MESSFNAYPWGRWIKWGVIILIAIIIFSSAISTYNGLAAADQGVKSQWSQVLNVMQRRADLITKEVEVVKGYTKHEEKVFGDIAAARSVLMNGSGDINEKLAADARIATAAKSMLLLVENYPDLKASEQFTNLQVQIEGSENRVSLERKRFIDAVQEYNLKAVRFPGSIFARLMGFTPKQYFEANPENPEVKF